jgi:hypothetical protein
LHLNFCQPNRCSFVTTHQHIYYSVYTVPSLKPTLDQHYEVSNGMERLYQLVADLETALQDAERQHTIIAKLRAQADAIVKLFEASHPNPA